MGGRLRSIMLRPFVDDFLQVNRQALGVLSLGSQNRHDACAINIRRPLIPFLVGGFSCLPTLQGQASHSVMQLAPRIEELGVVFKYVQNDLPGMICSYSSF